MSQETDDLIAAVVPRETSLKREPKVSVAGSYHPLHIADVKRRFAFDKEKK